MINLSHIEKIIQKHRVMLHDRYKVERIGVFGSSLTVARRFLT
jgi:predicted nucleotidyltransferase